MTCTQHNYPVLPPDFIKTVRMFRQERGYTLQQAKDEAIRMFDERGWPLPEYMRRLKV